MKTPTNLRYVATHFDREDYTHLIGVFNDQAGCSVKIFINDNNRAEKVVFFDDQVVSVEKFTAKVDFRNLINWELNTQLDVKNLLDKLVDDSLNTSGENKMKVTEETLEALRGDALWLSMSARDNACLTLTEMGLDYNHPDNAELLLMYWVASIQGLLGAGDYGDDAAKTFADIGIKA